jgi:hypothetical protein
MRVFWRKFWGRPGLRVSPEGRRAFNEEGRGGWIEGVRKGGRFVRHGPAEARRQTQYPPEPRAATRRGSKTWAGRMLGGGKPPPSKTCLLPAAAAAATAAAAITTAATATVFLGAGFIYVERPTVEFAAIESGDSFIALGVIGHFHETEPSGPSRFTIGHHANARYRAVRLECGPNCVLGCSEAEVSYKDVFQFESLSEFAEQRIERRLDGVKPD